MLLNGVESTAAKPPHSINAGAAFAMSLAELTPFLLARARSLTGKRELAEDLVQETMANAWRARQSFIPGTNLKAWLGTILRNEFHSHERRAWRQAPWCTMFEETIPAPPGQQLSAIDLCEAACAMNALPDPQRESLVLAGICGFSYEETALLLGGTLGTVKSRIARARLALLQFLQSRRVKLQPASCNAFDEWLVQLDQLRLSACRLLDSGMAAEFHRLAGVPKIPVQASAPGVRPDKRDEQTGAARVRRPVARVVAAQPSEAKRKRSRYGVPKPDRAGIRMTPAFFLDHIIRPGLHQLAELRGPVPSLSAERFLLAIALQESDIVDRFQGSPHPIGGPARGFWQFEEAGVLGVLTHPASRALAAATCERYWVVRQVAAVHRALEGHDMLAVALARLLILVEPRPLPDSLADGWSQYLALWRPGRPQYERWTTRWAVAHDTVHTSRQACQHDIIASDCGGLRL